MRLSTANIFDASIATLQKRQQHMQDSQQRLTSGKRIERASDDPTGAARAERALAAIGQVEANQRALDASRNSMTLSESALGDAGEILQQIRETLVAAGNASYSDPERAGLANKISGLRAQLLSIANRPDGVGGFLFSGQGSSNPPFLDTPGGVEFAGLPGSVETGNLDSFALTVDGRLAWEQGRSGNGSFVTSAGLNSIDGISPAKGWIDSGRVTDPQLLSGNNYQILISGVGAAATYTFTNVDTGAVDSGAFSPGQTLKFEGMAVQIGGAPADGDQFLIKPASSDLKLFGVLDQAVTDLRKTNRGGAEITQANLVAIRDLDAAMSNLQNVRSQVGERMNNLDGSENRMAALKQYSQQERSAAEDLDMVQGISDFQNQQTGYDAALKTYAMVQRMSLFQYINN